MIVTIKCKFKKGGVRNKKSMVIMLTIVMGMSL
jgi:hypothetical protein